MSLHLILDLPDDVEHALQREAARTGKTLEQVAIEWMEAHAEAPLRGSAEALMRSHGTWSMTPDERTRIEKRIEEERLMERDENHCAEWHHSLEASNGNRQ